MRLFHCVLAMLVCNGMAIAATPKAEPRGEPKVLSVHPFTAQRGAILLATVRGTGLRGATAAFVGTAPVRVVTEGVDVEPTVENGRKLSIDLVRLRIEVAADAKPGRYPFRLITPAGISNALPLYVTDLPVTPEPDGSHETPESAVKVGAAPAVFAGRLSKRGEADYYAINALAGQTFTFEVVSGLPQIAAAGSAATIPNFDPSLAIYEA